MAGHQPLQGDASIAVWSHLLSKPWRIDCAPLPCIITMLRQPSAGQLDMLDLTALDFEENLDTLDEQIDASGIDADSILHWAPARTVGEASSQSDALQLQERQEVESISAVVGE